MSSQIGQIVGKSIENTVEIHWKIRYGVSRAAHGAHHEIPGLTPPAQTPPAVARRPGVATEVRRRQHIVGAAQVPG